MAAAAGEVPSFISVRVTNADIGLQSLCIEPDAHSEMGAVGGAGESLETLPSPLPLNAL